MTRPLRAIDGWHLRDKVANHLTKIVKNRSIVLTGDMSHLSIDHMINDTFANIDAPRKYEFQEMNVHESDALRALLWTLPDYMLPMHITAEDVEQAIAGKAWLETSDMERGNTKCYDCAQPIGMKFKGTCVEVHCKTACEHHREFSVEIDFPTGVVVFADWPEHFNDFEEAGLLTRNKESVNYLKGQRQTTDNYARKQILHHFVGNTCPSWYFNAHTNTIQIGANGYNEDTGEDEIAEGFEHKGHFCTDLWWVTMLDEQYYNTMLAHAGLTENTKGKCERAQIPPGRYRFTCYGRTDDGQVNARGERIGECGEAPVFEAAHGRTIMSVVEAAGHSRGQYPTINTGDDVSAMFGFLDQNLNVIGNGIRNYGDFLSHHSLDVDEPMLGTAFEWNTNSTVVVRSVYPNFKKEYSLVWKIPLEHLPTDWLDAAVWFYTACGVYFEQGAENYAYAYPSKERNGDKDMLAALNRHRTEGMTDAEFFARVEQEYGVPFDGDIVAFSTERWRQERQRIGEFIAETLRHLNTELQNRT